MSQPPITITNQHLDLPYPIVALPQFTLTDSFIWDSGAAMILTNPNGPGGSIFTAPDIMSNSTVIMSETSPGLVLGANPVTNNAWLVEENASEIFTSDLRGSGDLTDIGSTTVISSGQGASSENIGLVGNSHLFLGMTPGLQFLSPIEIDSTSTVTLTTSPQSWASIIAAEAHQVSLGPPDPTALAKAICPFIGSLSQDYTPALVFGYNAQGGIASVGIRDEIIPGHVTG